MPAGRAAPATIGRATGFVLRGLAVAGLAALLAACSTTGRSFDTSRMDRIVPGQTTLEQASAILKAEPENVYRQRDGSATARWAHKASMVTDAVYFRRELWLRFGSDGRFQHVVERVNVQGDTGLPPGAARPPRQPDGIDQAMPRTVPANFPYGPAAFSDGPVVVYPVR